MSGLKLKKCDNLLSLAEKLQSVLQYELFLHETKSKNIEEFE